MREHYNHIISMGYCAGQFLLKYTEPIAYSTRVEGWACDYYDVDNVLISTGYAPLVARNTHSSYDMVKRYDNAARAIACDYSLSYEEQKERVNELLRQFVREATSLREGEKL